MAEPEAEPQGYYPSYPKAGSYDKGYSHGYDKGHAPKGCTNI